MNDFENFFKDLNSYIGTIIGILGILISFNFIKPEDTIPLKYVVIGFFILFAIIITLALLKLDNNNESNSKLTIKGIHEENGRYYCLAQKHSKYKLKEYDKVTIKYENPGNKAESHICTGFISLIQDNNLLKIQVSLPPENNQDDIFKSFKNNNRDIIQNSYIVPFYENMVNKFTLKKNIEQEGDLNV